MALKKKPVTGMKDVLPAEMQIREYVMNQIKETYKKFGFSQIETPCVEHIENLTSKQGGDNEKLIFKILKRGDKLDVAAAQTEADVVDGGLRYDLTLPLSRYYSNNAANLPAPFKALQMGSVWRADRPQKGRFRQFVQCDIDILGDPTCLAEIELILATTTALGKICPGNSFTVRINDRGILRGMAAYCGFPEEAYDQIFITLDKMDKIGMDGVKAELLEAGYSQEQVTKYLSLFSDFADNAEGVRRMGQVLAEAGAIKAETCENLAHIMDTVQDVAEAEFTLAFDPTLVRGMSYYTGTIFEVSMEGFGGSVAGGGRYDKMIGKFTGMETPACGFSIGFERIVTILLDQNFTVPGGMAKKAYLFEKGVSQEVLSQVIREASAERKAGVQVLVAQMNKNKKFQKEQLLKEGYEEFKEFYKDALKK
ncbi:MAG: histidine--tRNA ligase [Lachnospiraceae bacterium]|nr:histidine--tRNA ligase [Lachnospiraceae bacterium]